MADKKSNTFPIGRDAETGKFETVKDAKAHPKTSVVERIPKSGKGK